VSSTSPTLREARDSVAPSVRSAYGARLAEEMAEEIRDAEAELEAIERELADVSVRRAAAEDLTRGTRALAALLGSAEARRARATVRQLSARRQELLDAHARMRAVLAKRRTKAAMLAQYAGAR